jgi:single-strand DNA-binding protein
VRDYVKKGSKLYVEGRLTTRSWDDKDTGKKVYRTEIMVNDLVLLSGRGDGEGGGGGSTSYGKSSGASGGQAGSGGYEQRPAPDYGDTGITDDDIPF